MNPNDNRFGQGLNSGSSSDSRSYGSDTERGSTGYGAGSMGSINDGWSDSASVGAQDHLEADSVLRESYVTQPEIDVEALDISDIELGSSSRARWLLWGGLGLGMGLLAFKLFQRNRFVIQEKASSLKGMARDRIQSFRNRGEEFDESDSFVLQENARPDMVSEGGISDYDRDASSSSSFQSSGTSSASFGSETSLQSGGSGLSASASEPVSTSLSSYGAGSDGVSGIGSGIEDDKNLGRS